MVEELTRMINAAYAAGEEGLWEPSTARVFESEVREMLDAGELLLVRRDGELAGCVRVHALDASTGELGLLTAARVDSGVGGELIRLAEAWARDRDCTKMRLSLLVPREGVHPFKQRLHDWYTRLGYRPIGREDFATAVPYAYPTAVPCDLVSYEKAL